MEKQIAKLLRHQNFNKEFQVRGKESKDIANIALIRNLPLEKLVCFSVEEAILPLWLCPNANVYLKNLIISYSIINSRTAAVITNLVQNLTLLELHNCSMQHCDLVTIIDAVGKSHMRTLKLGVNNRTIDVNVLIDCIERSQLIDLYLSSCPFEQTQFSLLMDSIAHSTLQSLSLVRVRFNDEMMIAIENCIKGSGLTKLLLSECTFANNKIIGVMRAIQQSTIHSLDLSFSFFDDDIKDIVECMKRSRITKFISGDNVGHYDRRATMTTINLMEKHHALKYAGINCAFMNDETMLAICNAIENSALETLVVSKCGSHGEQIIKICDSIKVSSITSLDLTSANSFSATGIAAICDLVENHGLAKLKLTCSGLIDALIESILASIEKSELIKFNIDCAYPLSVPIKKRLKQIMLAQKLRAVAFHKTKSANMLIK